MSRNKRAVEQYLDGFRASDHTAILALLTDDVVWDMPGRFHLEGKQAFDGEIENAESMGRPEITLRRLVEEGDVVVAEGTVRFTTRSTGEMEAVFCDVFVFRDGLIRELTTYLTVVRGGEAG